MFKIIIRKIMVHTNSFKKLLINKLARANVYFTHEIKFKLSLFTKSNSVTVKRIT